MSGERNVQSSIPELLLVVFTFLVSLGCVVGLSMLALKAFKDYLYTDHSIMIGSGENIDSSGPCNKHVMGCITQVLRRKIQSHTNIGLSISADHQRLNY